MQLLSIIYLLIYILIGTYLFRNRTTKLHHPYVCIYFFYGLQIFSNVYLTTNDYLFEKLITSQIPIYKGNELVFSHAILFEMLSFLSLIFGVTLVQKKFWSSSSSNEDIIKTDYFLVIGILFEIIFFSKTGGLASYWASIALRSTANAGLGYYQSIAGYSLLLYLVYPKEQSRLSLLKDLIALIGIGAFGSRGLLIIGVLSKVFVKNEIKGAKAPWAKLFILGPILMLFLLVMLGIRKNGFKEFQSQPLQSVKSSITLFEEGFVARVGRLEREYVILESFDITTFWLGAEYVNLFTAPIPRSLYFDKRPVDTGVYVRLASLGKSINLDQAANDISVNSWPQQNWSGYMNFGLLGLLFYHILAGAVLKLLYILSQERYIFLVLYVLMFFGGGVFLSVPGIVKILTEYVLIYSIYILVLKFSKFNFS